MISTRPRVAEMALQVYGRALHPELFVVSKSRIIERGGYSAKIEITSSGHVVTWRYGGLTLTEVAAAAKHPLPRRRRLISSRLRGSKSDHVECRGGVIYKVDFKLEPLAPEVFWSFQEELCNDSQRNGMLHAFDPSGRLSMSALSYVHAESRNRRLFIQAFHTFPEDYAIVKSETQFILP